LAEDDILFSIAGTIGRTAIVTADLLPANTNQALAIIRCNPDQVDPRFLLYALSDTRRTQEAHARVVQSVQANFSLRELGDLEISLPSLPEQRRIAAVLGALDDKIETNRTQSAVALDLLQSHFESLIAPGLHYAGSGRALPEPWVGGHLGDWLDVLETGSRPKGGVAKYESGIPSIGAQSIVALGNFDFSQTKFVPHDYFDSMKRGHVSDFDVLLYKDGGRPGEFEPHISMFGMGYPFARFCINEHVYRMRVTPPLSQEYLYCWLSSDPVMEQMRRTGTGVAIPGLNSTAVKMLPFVVPPRKIVEQFDEVAGGLARVILAAAAESQKLAEIRGTLLPKLLSGELRVRDAA
jgi:type I restriction enzyme S subunit